MSVWEEEIYPKGMLFITEFFCKSILGEHC